MNLIQSLEAQFQRIDTKLNSNCNADSVNANYSNECAAIHQLFASTKRKKYENGLNHARTEMLKTLTAKRNAQLEQVNELKANMGENHQKNLNKLRRLSDSIESNYLVFSRSLISVFGSILSRGKLRSSLDFSKLD